MSVEFAGCGIIRVLFFGKEIHEQVIIADTAKTHRQIFDC